MIKKMALFILLGGLSVGVAASGYLMPLGTGIGISKYQVLGLGTGGMVVWLENDLPLNPDACNVDDKVVIKSTLPEYELMVSAIMAAYAQGKSVGFWSSGCTTTYFWGTGYTFPSVRDMWVTD